MIKKKFFFKNFLKKKFFLSMIPYPSGKLHLGHVRNYIINDILNKYYKFCNYNILSSIGWDSFGTPAENASIKKNLISFKWVYNNVFYMKNQLRLIKFIINWKYEFLTCFYNFYKISQFFIFKFINYRFIIFNNKIVNWDCIDKTILSNEQVVDGLSWRNNFIKYKLIKTYFLNVKFYKKDLLFEINNLKWNNKVKFMQKNWLLKFKFLKKKILIKNFFKNYYIKLNFKNHFNYIFIINFYLFSNNFLLNFIFKNFYFKKFFYKKIFYNFLYINFNFINLGLSLFLKNFYELLLNNKKLKNKLINNFFIYDFYFKNFLFINKNFFINKLLINNLFLFFFNILNFFIIKFKKNIIFYYNWNIKNWNFSRKKYWGNVFNIYNCNICLFYRKKIFLLPKKLKNNVNFNLINYNKFFNKNFCLNCLNLSLNNFKTLDTFFDSSWYFLYFLFKKKIYNFFNIDFYIGGIEHAILHLLYSRFFFKFLKNLKFLINNEPIKNLFTQGMVLNYTYYYIKNGIKKWINYKNINSINYFNKLNFYYKNKLVYSNLEKMSKSKNNGVDPYFIIKKYNLLSLNLSLIHFSPLSKDIIWSEKNIYNFKKILFNFFFYIKKKLNKKKFFYKKFFINNNDKIIINFFIKNFFNFKKNYFNLNFNLNLINFNNFYNIIIKFKFNNIIIEKYLTFIFINYFYPFIFNFINKIKYKNLNLNFLNKMRYIKIKNFFLKYIFFINNKKFGIFYIKNLFLILRIKNFIFLKSFKKFKLFLNKNTLNLN